MKAETRTLPRGASRADSDSRPGLRLLKMNWLLAGIALLGLGLRTWGINFGLPYLYHPDEGVPLTIATKMLQTGNFNPGFFHWSSLLFYLNVLLYAVYFVFGFLTGRFSSTQDIQGPDIETIAVGYAPLPEMILLSRLLTVVFGALCILLVYRMAYRLTGNKIAGWLAALFLAVETISVQNSQLIRPDVFVTFFCLLAVEHALKLLEDPSARNYVLAGAATGIAASFKYNAVLVCVAIIAAHLIRFGKQGLFHKGLYLAGAVSALAFFATTPYALLDWQTFLQIGPLQVASNYSSGHSGWEGDTVRWYLNLMWGTLGWLLPLAVAECVVILAKAESKGMVFVVFPVVYWILINLYTVHFQETVVPAVPFVLILAARFLHRTYTLVSQQTKKDPWGAAAAVVLLLVLPPLMASAASDARILVRDGRETSRIWVEQNIPQGSRIALEPYSPYADRTRFTVEGFANITAHLPQWYEDNGYEYVVLSYGSYGRFFEQPTQYPEYVARYNSFFEHFALAARFDDAGYEVRIYKTQPVVLPTVRLAKHFGFYAPWVELVGYEWKDPSLTLYWRVIESRRESLTATARVLDKQDQELVMASAALSVERVTAAGGIIQMPLILNLQPHDRPGIYRLEFALDAEGLGRVPLVNPDRGASADNLLAGTVEFPPAQPDEAEMQVARPANVRFGRQIELERYRIAVDPVRTDSTIHPGDRLSLTLFWKAVARADRDYTVFVHLLDRLGQVVAQTDALPLDGKYPTSVWDIDEILQDRVVLSLRADLSPGVYAIEMGLYEYPSLQRLAVSDVNGKSLGDHLILDPAIAVVK